MRSFSVNSWIRCIALLLLLAPHFLITRDLFDGVGVAFANLSGMEDGIYYSLQTSNWNLSAAFVRFWFFAEKITHIKYLFFVKAFFCLAFFGIYFELRHLIQKIFQTQPDEAKFIAILGVAVPTAYVFTASLVVVHLVCYWFMFFGHRLFHAKKLWNRALGLVLLLLSFQVASCMVFSLALEIIVLFKKEKNKPAIFSVLFLFLLCAGYFFITKNIFPTTGLYSNYNQFTDVFSRPGLLRLLKVTAMYLTWLILPIFSFILSWIFCLWIQRNTSFTDGGKIVTDIHALKISIFLCLAAAFPYIAVGKGMALFTVTAMGDGITEKLLRANYDSFFAPTWSNFSGRHAVLYSMMLAILSWFAARGIIAKHIQVINEKILRFTFIFIFSMQSFFVFSGHINKLETQFFEVSLRKVLSTLPAAPAGVVDLQYQPLTDWLFRADAANLVLREAWGRSDYYAMFHQTDDVRNDLMWQYHAYLLNQNGLNSPAIQHSMSMDGFPGVSCWTRYHASIPKPNFLSLLSAGWFPELVPAADVKKIDSDCQSNRVMPNPSPWKINIP